VAGGSWRVGRLNVAKLLVDESIDQEQHRLPRSFRLLVYPSAIDLSTSTLAFRGRADRAGDDPGSGHGGGSGHHMGPPPLDTAGLRELLNRTGFGMLMAAVFGFGS
jgi:hypothetical protein